MKNLKVAQDLVRVNLLPLSFLLLIFGTHLVFAQVMDAYFQSIVIYSLINIVLAVSLNLVNGFTGQFSIGHAGFMATGAYMSAFLTTRFPAYLGRRADGSFFDLVLINGEFLANTLAGGLLAAFVGLLVGLPSLKLKGDYLAIVTLGFGEIIRVLLLNTEAVGGARGLYGIPRLTTFFWAATWALICVIVVWRLVRSRFGRAFLAVREDEVAAESVGIHTTKTKTRAFVLSSFFAGVAGSLFAHYLAYLSPASFGFMKSIDVVVMVVLGGMGSITGSVIAAVFLTVLPEALRPLQEVTQIDFRMVIYSLALVVLMLTRPQGFLGTQEITDIFRRLKKRVANP